MRAAVLLSILCLICGLAALFGVHAVYVGGQAMVGLKGLVVAMAGAVVPPALVLGWRKLSRK